MKRFLISCIAIALYGQVWSQDSLSTRLTYDLATEAAVGTGDFTAFYLAANRHHTLGTRANTANLRGALHLEQPLGSDWLLSAAVDGIAGVHADHHAYLQQCYANLSYKSFHLEVGSRELPQVIRDNQLSTGSFIKGTNAKPIPQVRVGTNGFWTVPFTKEWVQVNFDFGYGKFLDSDYHETASYMDGRLASAYVKGALFHQKHLYIRSNPEKLFFVTVGIEHAVQFGGTSYLMDHGELRVRDKAEGLKAFWDVILPWGDSGYFENDSWEDWIFGNHLGSMTCQIGWNITPQHQVQAYLDNPFEDGSGMRKSNGWDGIWGLQYSNKASGRQILRGAVFEYVQTTNQCGPLHWDSGDYPEPVRSQITDYVTGNDNYYNHGIYGCYAHYGMTPGNPLITSPIYNKDGRATYTDNRIKAWHLGVNGEVTDRLSFLVKGSYREGWGTYVAPLSVKHHSFNALLQADYVDGPWHFSSAFAFDKGNIYGDCSTFYFKIGYHGKIL
ncbi:MAG: hypothetical protein J6W38_12265 [Prevotella sp.]|nr:hypothetical protein [Prevotella sp.]MBO7129556.1 hypothetical protein [Prevotella sp.]